MMSKQYLTTDARCLRVLACCGRAPVEMRAMNEQERTSVAALCDASGVLVDGGREKLRLILIPHHERMKATDAELDEPTDLES